MNYQEYMSGQGRNRTKQMSENENPEVQPEPTPTESPELPEAAPVESPELPEASPMAMDDLGVDLGVDVPDIPMPGDQPTERVVEDEFESAFRFAVIGVGQGGSRLAETFWRLGYRRVGCINTTEQDLASINIPKENKLCIGGKGAGKQPKVAKEIFRTHYEDILDFCRRAFAGGYDRAVVCIGAGGGSGAGGGEVVVDVLHELSQSLGIEKEASDAKVGVIVALPTRSEGVRVQENAQNTTQAIIDLGKAKTVSPIILLDNEKIKQIYPGLSMSKFWTTANSSVVSLFHLFNRIACQNSAYTTFDKADFETVLQSGLITFGAMPIASDKTSSTDISGAVRENLRQNILAGMDISSGDIAACVLIGDDHSLDNIPQDNIEQAYEQLTRLLGDGSTVHRGIYQGNKAGLVVYTIIGGLTPPEDLFSYFFKPGSARKYVR